jgi:hypothetical protein
MKMTVIHQQPAGDMVVCDSCNENWTDRPESGGFLFHSKAVCPACAPEYEASVQRLKEERFLGQRCPPDLSFADWVRRLRYATGDDQILICTS